MRSHVQLQWLLLQLKITELINYLHIKRIATVAG